MGYRDDAFYKLQTTPGVGESTNDYSNASFTWPSNRIRFLEAERTLSGKPNPSSQQLKRGYIRGLPQPGVHGSTFKPLKCRFQFNPQTIAQSVAMREDVYLSVLQDPVAFTQPFAGSVNFNFDLVFDRSLEVGAGKAPTGGAYSPADLNNPNYKTDVRDIGALADLQVLYSIIGQGFSKELIEFQKERLQQGVRQIVNKQGGADTSSTDAITESNIDQKTAESGFASDVNLGNAAFLIPNPVRVIFSSLFMVEGFITGTNVDFLKFSTNMVPIQVKVSISMNAVYIGYARQKTFLTDQLDKAQRAIDEQQRAIEEGTKEITRLAEQKIGYLGFSVVPEQAPSFAEGVNQMYIDDTANIIRYVIKNSSERHISIGFLPAPNFGTLPPFSDLEKSNSKMVVDWTFKVYGPYPSTSWASAGSFTDDSKLVGKYSGSIDSSSAPSWENDWAIEISGSDSRLTNTATKAVTDGDIESLVSNYKTNKWYYCTFDSVCRLTKTVNGDETTITKTGTYSARINADPSTLNTKRSAFGGKIPAWAVVSGNRPGANP